MQEISYGETKTYGELAGAAGSPKAARAVGNACAANPVAIIVPCHRVLAQNGLGGVRRRHRYEAVATGFGKDKRRLSRIFRYSRRSPGDITR